VDSGGVCAPGVYRRWLALLRWLPLAIREGSLERVRRRRGRRLASDSRPP